MRSLTSLCTRTLPVLAALKGGLSVFRRSADSMLSSKQGAESVETAVPVGSRIFAPPAGS